MSLYEEMGGAAASRSLYRSPNVDFVMRYRNEGTSQELVIPVHLVCNTPDEILHANIKANSLPTRKWVGTSEAHDGIAVICGGGPSISEQIGLIDSLHAQGAKVFALNGAANYLTSKGIWADYQVIADAREQTGDLIGPAKQHLFASQVHPSLFDKAPNAGVFHVNPHEDYNDFLELLPAYPSEYALIGSHGSVGNVAMALAYTMGYRTIHCIGFDSSHKGEEGHAFSQPMNDLEPMVKTEFGGKVYRSTFTMKAQANVFPRLAHDLQDLGCKIFVHGYGLLPDRWNAELAKTPEQRERDKYMEMWSHAEYRDMSPAVGHLSSILKYLKISAGETLGDFGCGTGRATRELRKQDIDATGIDIAPNALETSVPFVQACLWDLPELRFDHGICCDVMEHIPPEKVDAVLTNISRSVSRDCFFAIDNDQDQMGALIGAVLHLTRRPREWWVEKLKQHFSSVEFIEPNIYICRKAEHDGW